MKKKFYTAFLFAMMGLMPAQAQVVRTEQMRTVNAAEIEGQTVKKMLPVAFIHSDGGKADPEGKINYDSQGNIAQINYSDKSVENFEYSYNSQHKWITLLRTTKNVQNEVIAKLKTERAFDEKGRILSIKVTEFDKDAQKWYPVSDHVYSYDKET